MMTLIGYANLAANLQSGHGQIITTQARGLVFDFDADSE